MSTTYETDKAKVITTRVSTALAAEIEKAAAQEMLSVACYLRRLLAQAVRRVAV